MEGIVYAEEPNITFNSKGKIVYEGTTLFDSADLKTINTDIKSVLNKTNKNTTDIATLKNNLTSTQTSLEARVEQNETDITTLTNKLNSTQTELEENIVKNTTDIATLNTELTELKKSVSDGKSAVASAITAKGVSTASDATFETIVTNIKSLADNQYTSGYNAGVSASSINNVGSVFSETLGSGHNTSCSGSKTINSGSYKALVFIFNISLEDKSINSYSVNFSKGTQLYSGSMDYSKVYVLKCDTNTSITVNYNFQYSNDDSDSCFLRVIGIK